MRVRSLLASLTLALLPATRAPDVLNAAHPPIAEPIAARTTDPEPSAPEIREPDPASPEIGIEREAPYVAGQLLAAPPPGTTLAALAARVGGEVLAPVGRSGFGLLRVPDGAEALLREAGAELAPVGRVVGAGKKDKVSTTSTPAPALPNPWHLAAADICALTGPSTRVVAVLDTGVAYEDRDIFRRAAGLAGVTFVAPADFVELDGHPDDDHQHGTHIASIIASGGPVPGVAPGVSLMPIKVLDRSNRGTEWALVEGLHHAVDNGADVVNLSLSFPLGYVPSLPLRAALERAHQAGVVLVAAAGNEGSHELTWPAASRVVVSVGASKSDLSSLSQRTPYTNRSPALDILAPGGSLDADVDADGWPDGIVAETIDPADPSRLGYWLYEGTSQAAAIVSGAVVHLLEAGVPPRDVAVTIQQSTTGFGPWDAALSGTGADSLDLVGALASPASDRDVYVGLLPYVVQGLAGPTARARVVAVDDQGQPMPDVEILASVYTAGEPGWRICTTDATGSCTLLGFAAGAGAWAFRVDAVVEGTVAYRPSRALFATDAGEVLLDALQQAALPQDALLAVYWPGGQDDRLGNTLESWAVVDVGVGLLSSPLGLVFLPDHVQSTAVEGSLALDLDGTGLLSSPLGITVNARTLELDGTGLLSSPLGLGSLTLVGIDGTGLLSSPLGFHATDLYATWGTGLLSSPLGLGWSSQPILMDSGTLLGASLAGTAFEGPVTSGTLLEASGYEPATWMIASGVADVGLATVTTAPTPAQSAPPVCAY